MVHSLWGAVSNSNLVILQRFQNRVSRTNAPWYVLNKRFTRVNSQKIKRNTLSITVTHTNVLPKVFLFTGRLKRFKKNVIFITNRFHSIIKCRVCSFYYHVLLKSKFYTVYKRSTSL